jgi:release factor glutamine methyltransferase
MADLGTGSGAVGLSLLHELPLNSATVWMTDISTDAIDVARANAAGLGRPAAGARFEVGSWWDALPSDVAGLFDVVVSNPPYIARGDVEVESSVNNWEPHSALFSGDDGLHDIRVITADAPQWLRSGGLLVVEMGYTQAPHVTELFASAGLTDITVRQDLAGHDRFVSGVKP